VLRKKPYRVHPTTPTPFRSLDIRETLNTRAASYVSVVGARHSTRAEASAFRNKLDSTAAARLLIAIFQGFVLQAVWEPDQDLEPSFSMLDELVPRLLEPWQPVNRRE
jgi:hypothetical protein